MVSACKSCNLVSSAACEVEVQSPSLFIQSRKHVNCRHLNKTRTKDRHWRWLRLCVVATDGVQVVQVWARCFPEAMWASEICWPNVQCCYRFVVNFFVNWLLHLNFDFKWIGLIVYFNPRLKSEEYQKTKKYLTVNKAKLNECLLMSFTYVVSVYRINLIFQSVDRVHMITLCLLQIYIEDHLWAVLFACSGCICAGILVWVKKCGFEVNLTVIPPCCGLVHTIYDRLVNTDFFTL